MRILAAFETVWADVRFATRSLLKNQGFLVVVILSLALGIAANSTIFSVLDTLLYRPLPYPQPEKLVVIWETEQARPDRTNPPPIAELVDWKKQNHVFEDIALTSFNDTASVSGLGEPRPLRTQYVATEAQDRAQTILISHEFWKRELNSDPQVLGKSFTIEGVVSTIVGVMQPRFAPFYGGRIDLWVPINAASSRYSARIDHWLMPVARIKPGVTLAQAQTEMDVVASRLEQEYPATNKGVGAKVFPLHEDLYRFAGQALYPLFGAVAFVLLIACVNVANLLQFRTETRRKEYALRSSLGAGRRRLIQQLLTESGLLALSGGLLGIALTYAGIKLLVALAGDFPNSTDVGVDGRVLLFTLGVSLLTAILFGLAPAIQASRPDLNVVLREGERKTTTSSGRWICNSRKEASIWNGCREGTWKRLCRACRRFISACWRKPVAFRAWNRPRWSAHCPRGAARNSGRLQYWRTLLRHRRIDRELATARLVPDYSAR